VSPRQIVEVACECPYVECEQYISYSRGVLRRTYICRHPENAGCMCVLNEAEVTECAFCPTEEGEETKTVHIEVKSE
jgi:hypothetical protein